MTERILFHMDTPYRTPLSVRGWQFGDPDQKQLAVMGALRGNELQQMFVCALLIQTLQQLEADGALSAGVLVIPCANQFSMNVGRRFWAADNTDINRMFPGYDQGETTQRIAAHIFAALEGYEYGVHLTSFYLPGDHLPHVRVMSTGYEQLDDGLAFGLPYLVVRQPQPYDTTTLNYNWQVWNTRAFSLYTPETEELNPVSARQAVAAVVRFLCAKGLCDGAALSPLPPVDAPTRIVQEASLHNILSTCGGLMLCHRRAGEAVAPGDVLADILDACTGQTLEQLQADCPGRVFFVRRSRLIGGHEVAFRLLPE